MKKMLQQRPIQPVGQLRQMVADAAFALNAVALPLQGLDVLPDGRPADARPPAKRLARRPRRSC